MKVGTKSVLFGVHQFICHFLFVLWAWRLTYASFPTFKETIAIAVHDIGYFGKDNLDGEEGERHPETGAKLMSLLFGHSDLDAIELVLFHSRSYAKLHGATVSKLCVPDKLATLLYPDWLYLLLANLSGEIVEYKTLMGASDLSDLLWLEQMKKSTFAWSIANADTSIKAQIQRNFGARVSGKSPKPINSVHHTKPGFLAWISSVNRLR